MTTTAQAAETTAAPATTAAQAAATTNPAATGRFYCNPGDPTDVRNTAADCVCPKESKCGKGSCKENGKGDTVCDVCTADKIKVNKKCVGEVRCKGGKVVTPPKMLGEPCKCDTPASTQPHTPTPQSGTRNSAGSRAKPSTRRLSSWLTARG